MICNSFTHNHTRYSPSGVYFVSRYRGDSHYCVDGEEITIRDLDDDGTAGVIVNGDPERAEKLRLWLLDEHAAYIRWHVEQKPILGDLPMQPWKPIHYAPQSRIA